MTVALPPGAPALPRRGGAGRRLEQAQVERAELAEALEDLALERAVDVVRAGLRELEPEAGDLLHARGVGGLDRGARDGEELDPLVADQRGDVAAAGRVQHQSRVDDEGRALAALEAEASVLGEVRDVALARPEVPARERVGHRDLRAGLLGLAGGRELQLVLLEGAQRCGVHRELAPLAGRGLDDLRGRGARNERAAREGDRDEDEASHGGDLQGSAGYGEFKGKVVLTSGMGRRRGRASPRTAT